MKKVAQKSVFGSKGGSTKSQNSKGVTLLIANGKIYKVKNSVPAHTFTTTNKFKDIKVFKKS